MKSVVCATFLALFCSIASPGAYARLTITGPDGPVISYHDATLECLSDNDSNMEDYTFEQYCKLARKWIRLVPTTWESPDHYNLGDLCFFEFNVNRSDGRLLLHVTEISKYTVGPYRCVRTNNLTGENDVSNELTLDMIFLDSVFFTQFGSPYSKETEVLWAESGSTVTVTCQAQASHTPLFEWSQEFSDWILPSDTLVLKHVSKESEGKYICQARHPAMRSLVVTRAFQLQVHTRNRVQIRDVVYVMSFVVIPAVMLLILVFTLFTVLIRYRRKQMRKPQISLVSDEKRAPIYKGSLQSLNSTTSDTQPLVM